MWLRQAGLLSCAIAPLLLAGCTVADDDGLSLLYWGPDKDAWRNGYQTFRCYVATLDRKKPIRGGATLRNLGDKAVPVG